MLVDKITQTRIGESDSGEVVYVANINTSVSDSIIERGLHTQVASYSRVVQ